MKVPAAAELVSLSTTHGFLYEYMTACRCEKGGIGKCAGIWSCQNRQGIRTIIALPSVLLLRLAAAEADIDCYESAYPLFHDEAGWLAQLQDARALGFAGASCIHPKQVTTANRVFTPTAEEIAYASGVVEAAGRAAIQGSGIAQFQGKMIDRPFLRRAQSILSRAE